MHPTTPPSNIQISDQINKLIKRLTLIEKTALESEVEAVRKNLTLGLESIETQLQFLHGALVLDKIKNRGKPNNQEQRVIEIAASQETFSYSQRQITHTSEHEKSHLLLDPPAESGIPLPEFILGSPQQDSSNQAAYSNNMVPEYIDLTQ